MNIVGSLPASECEETASLLVAALANKYGTIVRAFSPLISSPELRTEQSEPEIRIATVSLQRCCICGARSGGAPRVLKTSDQSFSHPPPGTLIHCAHTFKRRAVAALVGVPWDASLFVPLCGLLSTMPSCHNAFDSGEMCLLPNADGSLELLASRRYNYLARHLDCLDTPFPVSLTALEAHAAWCLLQDPPVIKIPRDHGCHQTARVLLPISATNIPQFTCLPRPQPINITPRPQMSTIVAVEWNAAGALDSAPSLSTRGRSCLVIDAPVGVEEQLRRATGCRDREERGWNTAGSERSLTAFDAQGVAALFSAVEDEEISQVECINGASVPGQHLQKVIDECKVVENIASFSVIDHHIHSPDCCVPQPPPPPPKRDCYVIFSQETASVTEGSLRPTKRIGLHPASMLLDIGGMPSPSQVGHNQAVAFQSFLQRRCISIPAAVAGFATQGVCVSTPWWAPTFKIAYESRQPDVADALLVFPALHSVGEFRHSALPLLLSLPLPDGLMLQRPSSVAVFDVMSDSRQQQPLVLVCAPLAPRCLPMTCSLLPPQEYLLPGGAAGDLLVPRATLTTARGSSAARLGPVPEEVRSPVMWPLSAHVLAGTPLFRFGQLAGFSTSHSTVPRSAETLCQMLNLRALLRTRIATWFHC